MDVDVEVFTLLEVLFKALASSVEDPVCFEDPVDGSKSYYSRAEIPLMHKRIQTYGAVIVDFYKRHRSLQDHFFNIEEHANTGNRYEVTTDIEKLLRGTRELLDFTEEYCQKNEDLFFYPSHEGFSFTFFPIGHGEFGKLGFNPEGSYEGAMGDLEVLENLLGKFHEKPGKLKYPVKPSTTVYKDGDELKDYYTSSLEKVKEFLLKDFNFDLED